MPDLRSARLALGLSIDDAAALTHENRGLLQTQEAGGTDADKDFVAAVMRVYVGRARRSPPAVSVTGDPLRVRQMRIGVGLGAVEAAAQVLVETAQTVRAAEEGRSGWSATQRTSVWTAYADWYWRRERRSRRTQAT